MYDDIRNMVRRDRNHASVILWEPILNETGYPDHFAENVHTITHEEYPFQGAFTACDGWTKGSMHFDVKYGFRPNDEADDTYFVREWGDNVDGWSAQNSNSRARRSWGEAVQLVQSTTNAGKITVRARTLYEGINTALPASITIESVESPYPLLYSEIGSDYVAHSSEKSNSLHADIEALNTRIREMESELQEFRLQEVQKQQDKFDTRDR